VGFGAGELATMLNVAYSKRCETEPDVPIENNFADSLQLIVPNLHRRYSGVTATNRMVAPKLAKMLAAAWLGPDAPEGIARMGFADLAKLWHRRTPLIWHARRNNEMIAGVLLRFLGWPLKLVFTSAAQRHHTWITRWLIRQMDAIIATSELSASFLKVPATVIPHGVDTDVYAPPPDRNAAFAEAGLPGRYAIGCFGRVRAQKGSDVFVAAMCRLLPRYPDFTAVMVGAITPEQQGFANGLRRQIEAAGLNSRIVITGEIAIEEVQRWYQRLTIYAFTSRNEGFGLTLIEAMAVGAALVAARAGAAELVVEDGVTGVLTPPGDIDALVAALEPLMRDQAFAAAMGERARTRVLTKFSLDAEAGRIAEIYRNLSHRSSP
jgi:mannosyltransferase